MLVRVATFDDCEALYSLVCIYKASAPDKELFAKLFKKTTEESRHHVVLAFENNKAVGFADVDVKLLLSSCSLIGVVNDFFVDENYRSHGIGTAILMQINGLLRSAGCSEIYIHCTRVDVRSQSFLERHKFIKSKHLFTYSITK